MNENYFHLSVVLLTYCLVHCYLDKTPKGSLVASRVMFLVEFSDCEPDPEAELVFHVPLI